MDLLNFILANVINGILGVVLLILGYKVFSLITKWDFREVLDNEKNNSGASGGAVVISAFFIALAIIIAAAAF